MWTHHITSLCWRRVQRHDGRLGGERGTKGKRGRCLSFGVRQRDCRHGVPEAACFIHRNWLFRRTLSHRPIFSPPGSFITSPFPLTSFGFCWPLSNVILSLHSTPGLIRAPLLAPYYDAWHRCVQNTWVPKTLSLYQLTFFCKTNFFLFHQKGTSIEWLFSPMSKI